MEDLNALFADAAARGKLRFLTLCPIGAPENRMWQCSVRYSGSDGWRVFIEPTPTIAFETALNDLIATEGRGSERAPLALPFEPPSAVSVAPSEDIFG